MHYGDGGGWLTVAVVYTGAWLAVVLLAVSLATGLFYLAEVRSARQKRFVGAVNTGAVLINTQRAPALSTLLARVPDSPSFCAHPFQLVEEYPSVTSRLLRHTARAVVLLHCCLYVFDTQPVVCLALGAAAHCAYLALLPAFPAFRLTSSRGLAALGLCVASHIAWGRHFYFETYSSPEFIAGFFVVAVWAVPFGLLLGYTSGDTTLPGGFSTPVRSGSASDFAALRASPPPSGRRGRTSVGRGSEEDLGGVPYRRDA